MMQSHQVISDIIQLSEAKSYALVCSSVPRTKKTVAGVLWIGGLSELSKPPAPTKEHINLGLCSSCLSMLDFVLLGWTTQTTKSEEFPSIVLVSIYLSWLVLLLPCCYKAEHHGHESMWQRLLVPWQTKRQANQSETGGYTTPQTQCPASFNQASSLTFHSFPNNAITVCIHWRISLLSKSGALACNHVPQSPSDHRKDANI